MTLWSTQSLREMSTRNLPGGKKRSRARLTTLPPSMRRMSVNVRAPTSRKSNAARALGGHDGGQPLNVQPEERVSELKSKRAQLLHISTTGESTG
jgi:hypothetical protein